MNVEINRNVLELMTGDITTVQADVIVNAANGTLLGGGGVDGAIHRAAGSELRQECERIRKEELHGEELPTGDAVMTKGYNLPADYVIHTVGPIWEGGEQKEAERLSNCYKNSLALMQEHHLQHIAFPSISTGAYRFPIELAAAVALETVVEYLKKEKVGKVTFVLFSEADKNVYETTYKNMFGS